MKALDVNGIEIKVGDLVRNIGIKGGSARTVTHLLLKRVSDGDYYMVYYFPAYPSSAFPFPGAVNEIMDRNTPGRLRVVYEADEIVDKVITALLRL